ncbi:MAG: hypothetical protein LQ349_005157 [Xanthoria aureola]|nr:MAG: hypothetical protein LQ349_005157 [Xanthoria aureola]
MPSSPHDNQRLSKGMGLSIDRKQTKLAVQLDHTGARPEHTGGPGLVPQPKTGPISNEQLVVEVKYIYAGLVMVEAKRIGIDETQPAVTEWNRSSKEVGPESAQWHALIALHKTLLHEHHDFLLASQHPSASPALRKMASKYATPAIIWSNWIHGFLERLRRRLPGSRDHMLAFVFIAYSMTSLFRGTGPVIEDTWIECLGELARHRMAIEFGGPTDLMSCSSKSKWLRTLDQQLTPQAGQVQTILPLKGIGLDIAPSNFALLSNFGSVPQRIFNPGSMLANDVSSGLEYTPKASCRSVSTKKWMEFIEDDGNMGGVLGDKTSQRPLPDDYTLRGQSPTGRDLPPIWFLPAVDKVDKHDTHTTSEFISPRERLKCLGISVSRSSVQSVALEAWFKITSLTNG